MVAKTRLQADDELARDELAGRDVRHRDVACVSCVSRGVGAGVAFLHAWLAERVVFTISSRRGVLDVRASVRDRARRGRRRRKERAREDEERKKEQETQKKKKNTRKISHTDRSHSTDRSAVAQLHQKRKKKKDIVFV